MQPAPGELNETVLQALDLVLDAAGRHGIKLTLNLAGWNAPAQGLLAAGCCLRAREACPLPWIILSSLCQVGASCRPAGLCCVSCQSQAAAGQHMLQTRGCQRHCMRQQRAHFEYRTPPLPAHRLHWPVWAQLAGH